MAELRVLRTNFNDCADFGINMRNNLGCIRQTLTIKGANNLESNI